MVYRDLILATAPWGYWEFASGAQTADSSGHARTGTLSFYWGAGASLTPDGAGESLLATGGSLASFERALGSWITYFGATWTVAWLQVPGPTVQVRVGGSSDGFVRLTVSGGSWTLYLNPYGFGLDNAQITGVLPSSSNPLRLALRYTGSFVQLWADGDFLGELAAAPDWFQGTSLYCLLFEGAEIDDLVLYDFALSGDQLAAQAWPVVLLDAGSGTCDLVSVTLSRTGYAAVEISSPVLGEWSGAIELASPLLGVSDGAVVLTCAVGAGTVDGAVRIVSAVAAVEGLLVEAHLSLWVGGEWDDEESAVVDGLEVAVVSASLSHRNGDALWGASVVLAVPADQQLTPVDSAVWVVLNGRPWALLVDGLDFDGPAPAVSDRVSLRLVGRGAYLGGERAEAVDVRYPEPLLASELCAGVLGLEVDWQCADWLVLPYRLDGDGAPLEVAARLPTAIGSVLEQAPEGGWQARPLLPSPSDLAAAAPVAVYTDMDSTINLSSSVAYYRGATAVRVRDSDLGDQDRIEWEPDTTWGWSGLVRFYPSPWRDPVFLQTTPGTLVWVGDTVRELEEMVEFEGGSGAVQYPVEEVLKVEWISESLGYITVEPYRSELSVPDTGRGVAVVTYSAHSQDLRLEAPTEAVASQLLYEVASGFGAVAVECYRGAGTRYAEDVADALLCSEPAAIARGRYELDLDHAHQLWTLDCPLDVFAACGAVVDWVDAGISRRGIVEAVEHSVPALSDAGVAFTRLEVRAYAS